MNKHQLDRLLRSDQAVKFQTSLLKTMMPIDKIKNKRNPDASISEWFSRLNTRVETKLQEWLELFNVEPACKPECPYCCYQPILVNQFEAKAILGYLSENNKLDEVMNSLKAWKGQVSYEALKTPNVNNEQEIYRLKEYWFQAKLPCPLLKNNKCVAYPVRPSSCITYLTFGQMNECQITFDVPLSVRYEGIESWIAYQVSFYISRNSNILNANEMAQTDLLANFLIYQL